MNPEYIIVTTSENFLFVILLLNITDVDNYKLFRINDTYYILNYLYLNYIIFVFFGLTTYK